MLGVPPQISPLLAGPGMRGFGNDRLILLIGLISLLLLGVTAMIGLAHRRHGVTVAALALALTVAVMFFVFFLFSDQSADCLFLRSNGMLWAGGFVLLSGALAFLFCRKETDRSLQPDLVAMGVMIIFILLMLAWW